MLYHIHPTPETLASLPVLLRPSAVQRRVPHDISLDAILFPVVRDAVIYRPVDWLALLEQHGVQLNWPGLGTVSRRPSVIDQNRWEIPDDDRIWGPDPIAQNYPPPQPYISYHSQQQSSQTPGDAIAVTPTMFEKDGQQNRGAGSEAIVQDPTSGQKIVNPLFERCVFDMSKWNIDGGVLDFWPELAGQIILR